MRFTTTFQLVAILGAISTGLGQLKNGDLNRPVCEQRVALFASNAYSAKASENLVEVRACEAGVLQLIARGKGSRTITVETNRTSIVSAAFASESVFAIQTAGASSNMIHVILFNDHTPRVALERSAKAYAQLSVAWKTLTVLIETPGHGVEKHEFSTGVQ